MFRFLRSLWTIFVCIYALIATSIGVAAGTFWLLGRAGLNLDAAVWCGILVGFLASCTLANHVALALGDR